MGTRLCCFHSPKSTAERNDRKGGTLYPSPKNLRVFSSNELRSATRNFHPTNIIGRGGFGVVYKGILRDGSLVAIKSLSTESKQGTNEFLTEIDMVSNVRHPNLVRLIGCCVEDNNRMLVYEYLENNSLANALLGTKNNSISLDWSKRAAICLGTAHGLLFLHEEAEPHIVHRDIKASNILLDKDLVPKIGDFGLAKLFPDSVTHISTRVAGTMGYLAPEYALLGQLTKKADIYSFGVLILEVISGRSSSKSVWGHDMKDLLEWVWKMRVEDKLLDVVDRKLEGYPEEEVLRFIKVALCCTQAASHQRPSMKQIRDTSVFVRLRPAWEDLRSYLTAKGRKRFEVYVCTMAERDYALEMWRLLDPETHLISSSQLLDRVVCVKPGARKSLEHVFKDGICHPKMAMVIDDRLQVWEDRDQPRVHVVPAFTPYYAPQAEMANAVPVLCVARNVACNVRGGFFKEFDDDWMRRICALYYENEVSDLPYSPDVSDYLMSEDTNAILSSNRDVSVAEGMTGPEAAEKWNQARCLGEGRHIRDQALSTHFSLDDSSQNGASISNIGSSNMLPSLFVAVLQEIGRRCESKVEFKPIIASSKDPDFSVEVLFSSERIGMGMGKTRKEAQLQAAENALRNLESNYISFILPTNRDVNREKDKLSVGNENGFLEDLMDTASDEPPEQGYLHGASTSEHLGQHYSSERLSSVLCSIKELCMEGQCLVFQDQAPASVTLDKGEHYFQVELSGHVLGKGIAASREEAKFQAAQAALNNLKTAVGIRE